MQIKCKIPAGKKLLPSKKARQNIESNEEMFQRAEY